MFSLKVVQFHLISTDVIFACILKLICYSEVDFYSVNYPDFLYLSYFCVHVVLLEISPKWVMSTCGIVALSPRDRRYFIALSHCWLHEKMANPLRLECPGKHDYVSIAYQLKFFFFFRIFCVYRCLFVHIYQYLVYCSVNHRNEFVEAFALVSVFM